MIDEGELRECAKGAGVRFFRHTRKHWQLKSHHFVVDYFPADGRVQVRGMNTSIPAPRTSRKLVQLALEGPPSGRQVLRVDLKLERLRLFEHSPFCHWCLAQLTRETATIDHRIPIARGGTNRRVNLVLSCAPCNNKRGHAMPEIHEDLKGSSRAKRERLRKTRRHRRRQRHK